MLAGWSKVTRRSFLRYSPARSNTAISLEPIHGKQIKFLGDAQTGRIVGRFWSSLSIYWLSVIRLGASFWWWIMSRITKVPLFSLLYHYLNIVFWWFGCLLILQNSTWLSAIGNTWKNLLVWINCTTQLRMFLLLLNICWRNKMIQPAFLECLFLNYYERLLSCTKWLN